MTHPMSLDEAKAILRGKQSAQLWQLGAAADVVLAHAEGMESRARNLLDKADTGDRRDAVMENIQIACRYILGETSAVRVAGVLRPSVLDAYGPGEVQ